MHKNFCYNLKILFIHKGNIGEVLYDRVLKNIKNNIFLFKKFAGNTYPAIFARR